MAEGKQIAVIGWRQVLATPEPEAADGVEAQRSQVLPSLASGLRCGVEQVELKALKTLPPKHYTQGELVKAMKGVAKLVDDPRLKQKLKETTGIGTEATRASTITGLLDRGYLLRKGRTIRASDAAFTLIDAVPAAIADPGMTAIWEQALDMIEAGQMTLDSFIAKQSAWVAQLVQEHRGATLSIALPCQPRPRWWGKRPAFRGTPSARLLLQRCARPVCPPSGDGARRSLLHESRPPPFP